MGRWGEFFFEGDSDLDEASDISHDAGIELYSYELDEPGEKYPIGGKGLEATREHLNNNGVLSGLFEKYLSMKESELFYGKELRLVLTGKTLLTLQRILS
jgi:hypothetical protein